MKRIGIFSGTFDPVHDGHLLFADAALQAAGLDEIYIVVQESPWHKEAHAEFEDRLEMAAIATEISGDIRLLDTEEIRVGETHTVDETMRVLRDYFEDAEFTLLIGGDAFENIESWDDYEELIKSVSFVIGLRTEDDGEIITPLVKRLGADAKIIASPLPFVSSTKIRNAIAENEQPKGLDDDVLDYIHEHKLYRS